MTIRPDIESECQQSFSVSSPRGERPFIPRQWPALVLLAAVLVVLPFVFKNNYFLLLFNVMALNALVVLGLNLLIGSTGQVSLGHAAFYGMGAYLSAIASTTWGWPLLPSLLFALSVTGFVSFLLALPTLRLEGHYLVMATLGFNIIVNIVAGQWESVTGGPSGFPGIPALHVGPWSMGTDRAFYVFIWSLFFILFGLALNLTDSRVGRALLAIHERELTAQALGIPTYRYKVTVFVWSALVAALAGFCYAHYVTFISPKTFDIFTSVQVVTMVALGGMGSLWGGLIGTVILTAMPTLLQRFEDLHMLFYGLILMGGLVFFPRGIIPALAGWLAPLAKGLTSPRPPESTIHTGQPETPNSKPESLNLTSETRIPKLEAQNSSKAPVLSLRDISLAFGGLQVLQGFSLDVFPSEITALIGPNGAGKTTLLNVVSGLLRPQEGEIRLCGQSLADMAPYRIAASGLGRTFQAVQTYHGLTVLENLLLGFHVQGRCGFLPSFLHSAAERHEEARLRARAMSLLHELGLSAKAEAGVSSLSLIEQKLLELARALALEPAVLLLDEPVGGLNPRESRLFADVIAHLRHRGMGVILVEHDMSVVMQLADRVAVLQYGSLIAVGTPREIQENPRVIAAYLGGSRSRREGGR